MHLDLKNKIRRNLDSKNKICRNLGFFMKEIKTLKIIKIKSVDKYTKLFKPNENFW